MPKTIKLSEAIRSRIVLILLMINPVIGMAVDLIAPSLPAISEHLNVAPVTAKNLIAIYLLGYAVGNFITGFLTDALGRKRLMLISFAAFALASTLPLFVPHYLALLMARLLQGLTLGAVAVIIRATFSDILTADKLVKLGTLLGSTWALGPIIGPVVGGYLQSYFGWQAIFMFFVITSLLAMSLCATFIPETHFARQSLQLSKIGKNLKEVLSHRLLINISLLMGCVYSLLVVFSTVGPFVIQSVLHFSPIFFGQIAFGLGLLFIGMTFVSRWSLGRFTVEKLYQIPTLFAFIFTTLAWVISLYKYGSLSLIIAASAACYLFCAMIFPMSMGKGLTFFKHIAGTASALMFLISYSLASLLSWLVSFFHVTSIVPLTGYYALVTGICLLIYVNCLRGELN